MVRRRAGDCLHKTVTSDRVGFIIQAEIGNSRNGAEEKPLRIADYGQTEDTA